MRMSLKYFVQICDEKGQPENIWIARNGEVIPRIGESFPVDRDGTESDIYKVRDVVYHNSAKRNPTKGKLELFMGTPTVIIHRQSL